MKLVVVESPGKIKKIASYLPEGYKVVASYGHVRDLPNKDLGIEFEGERVKPKYHRLKKSSKYIKTLEAAASHADEILLATDPDREGEAIAWHVRALLGVRKYNYTRIEFNEITRAAVQRALDKPRELDLDRVNAQQARRLLDRLVGWGVSPFCWQRLGAGTSAGRVQSVAVRLVAEREQEIREFEPETYHELWAWLRPQGTEFDQNAAQTLAIEIHENQKKAGVHPALFQKLPPPPPGAFKAKLLKSNGKKVGRSIDDPNAALELRDMLLLADWLVTGVEKKERKRRPPPPFITSTLQQAATNRYKLPPKAAMRAAQKLYEAGLITYMRTDSPSISGEALGMARRFIEENLGPEMLPTKPRFYSAKKGSGAQEAHECIRPTSIDTLPKSIEARFKGAEGKVYRLIWERFLASQMPDAIFDDTKLTIEARRTAGEADIDGGPRMCEFEAKGSMLRFKGWLRLTMNHSSADKQKEDDGNTELPEFSEQDPLDLARLDVRETSTKPPARYNQASLIRALEKEGVGRPATYAQIMDTIISREYVREEQRQLYCTQLGEGLVQILREGFGGHFIELSFTREVEETLDKVAEGGEDWERLVIAFRDEIEKLLAGARKAVSPIEALVQSQRAKKGDQAKRVEPKKIEKQCPLCQKSLMQHSGRYGKWLQCEDHPKCKFKGADLSQEQWDFVVPHMREPCPICAGPMAPKATRKNDRLFMSCLDYPNCKGTRNILGSEAVCKGGKKKRNSRKKATKRERASAKTREPASTKSRKMADSRSEPVSCPLCDSQMVVRKGKNGEFWGCTRYPECRGTREMRG